jgi:hypothetical protein
VQVYEIGPIDALNLNRALLNQVVDMALDCVDVGVVNWDGCGYRETIERKKLLVAEACNHPNCLVLPFRLELIRFAA